MAATYSQGTTITFANSGGTPLTIGGVKNFSRTGGTANDIKVTTLADTAHKYKVGLRDFGELNLEMIYYPDDTGQAELRAAALAQAERQMVITLVDGTANVWTFNVVVKSFDVTGNLDDVLQATCNCRISGAVVET